MTPWLFADPPNTAVIVRRSVLSGAEWIGFVSHDEDDGCWQFLGNLQAALTEADGAVIGLREILALDPFLAALADLPPGWRAWRPAQAASWLRACRP